MQESHKAQGSHETDGMDFRFRYSSSVCTVIALATHEAFLIEYKFQVVSNQVLPTITLTASTHNKFPIN